MTCKTRFADVSPAPLSTQIMAGRPISEILNVAEEERARQKHLRFECSAAREALAAASPNPSNPLEGREGGRGALSEADGDSSDSDEYLQDAELDAPERSRTAPPGRSTSFGGFPPLPQGVPLSRRSAALNIRKPAGIAVPSFLSFPATKSFTSGGTEEKGSSKGGSGSEEKCLPMSERDVFNEMAAAGEAELQSLSMLVDDSHAPDGTNGII